MDINDGALSFDAVINTSDLDKMTKVVEDKIIGMTKSIETNTKQFGDVLNKLGITYKETFESSTLKEFKDGIDKQRSAVSQLEKDYRAVVEAQEKLSSQPVDWSNGGVAAATQAYKEAKKAVSDVSKELDSEKKILEEREVAYSKIEGELTKLNSKQTSYITQLQKIREEMISLQKSGETESIRYRELQNELEETGTAYRKVQQEQKALTTAGNATISGLLSGMSALSGAFSAGSGVMSLFVTDNERLAAIQTKLQAAMAITIGLQQVSTALHSTSSFRMNVTTKVTNLYSASVLRLGTSFIKMGVSAGVARVAAQALMATLTLGLSVAITGLVYLIDKYIDKQKELSEQAKKNAEKLEQYNKSIADSAAAPIASYKRLQAEWDTLANDLKKKEKFVKDNKNEFVSLGIEVNNVVDAENALVNNTEAVIKSLSLKARALATQSLAIETYKEAIQKQVEAENRAKTPTKQEFAHSKAVYEYKDVDGHKNVPHYIGTEASIEAGKKIQAEADKLFEKADNLTKDQIELLEKSREELEKSGIKPSEKVDKPKKTSNKSEQFAQKKIEADQWLLNKQKELSNEQIKAELESEQKALDLQKDSYDKRIKQNELNYRKELQSIKDFEANKEKAQQEAAKKIYTSENGGNDKGFDFSKFDMSKLPKGLRPEDIKEQVTRLATEVQAAWENADMLAYEEMTKDFMSFQQQKADVTKTYQDLITQYERMGLSDRVALIKQERDQTLGELSAMEIQTSDLWKNLFQNMDNLSEKTIKDIIAKLRELVKNIEDVDIKNALTKQLDDAEQSLGSKNPFSAFKKGIEDYKNASDEASKNKAMKNIGESAKSMSAIVTESLGSVVKGLKDLGMMDEDTEKILGDVMNLVSSLGDAGEGIARLSAGDITAAPQAIAGVVGTITSVFSLFDSKSRDIEKKIKAHKKQLIELGRVYKDIEYQVNNAVGEDYYSEQFKAIENLKKQQKEVEGLLYQENRKKKKNRDDDAINGYKDQLAEIPRQIQDIEREITETLVQTSFKDLSNQLADVLVSAFEAGEDAAKDFDKTFNKVIANAVRNSLKLKVLDKPINEFTEALSEYMLDNNYSANGFNFEKWRNILKEAGESFTSGLQEFEKYFDLGETDRQGATGGFAQASQDSINELNGLMYATRQMIGDIRNDNREDLLIQRSIVGYLITIAENTGHLKAVQQYLHNIDTYGIKMKP